MKQFEEGDKVQPRTGGQTMVVDAVLRQLVTCLLVTDDGLKEKVYPANELKLVGKAVATDVARHPPA